MGPSLLAGLAVASTVGLIAVRVPIAYALLLGSTGGLFLFYAWPPGLEFSLEAGLRPTMAVLGDVPFRFVHSYEFSTIPLYILLGAVAHRAGITTDVFNSMRVLLGRLPGGLAIASVFGCGGFSALSGSSLACAAAMGRIAVPEMLRNRYSKPLASGTIAVGGTLGALIPPSIPFLIFAILAEQSVGRLLLAGVVPGLLTLVGYVVTILVWVWLRPGDAPGRDGRAAAAEIVAALIGLWPAALLLAIIIAGIFFGFFTTIQAAAVSVIVATLIGVSRGTVTAGGLFECLKEAALQSTVLFAMAFGAKLMITLVAATNLSADLLAWLDGLGLGPWETMFGIVGVLIVMGMFLDPAGILLLMVPLTLPIVEGLGFDLIWYAVIFVKLLEIGLITPPVGLNAFVIKSSVPDALGIDLKHVFGGIAPFLLLEFVVLGLLLAFPVLSLILPDAMW